MASQGSQIFNTMELLGMEKTHDKLIRIGVAHLTSMSTKQCDIRSFFVSGERSLLDLNDTLGCAIFVIQAFEFEFIIKNIEFSSLLFSFEHFCFSTYFFDNFTLRINLPNVTLSNTPPLVYITMFGETDGVVLSRLECILLIHEAVDRQVRSLSLTRKCKPLSYASVWGTKS